MLLRPQRAGWGGWSPAFGSFGGERQNSGVIAARLLEDLGVKNSTLCHVYLCSFSSALWIGVMLMADSLNHRQGFLLGGNIIFLSVNTLYLCHVLKLRLFSRFGGSSPHHHNDHGTNCGFYPFLFIVFHFEVWQKKYVDYLTDTSENIRRPCLISIFKFPSIQLFDRSEVLNGSGRRTGVVAGSVATLGTCPRWPFFSWPRGQGASGDHKLEKKRRSKSEEKNFCSLEMVSEGARLDKVKSSEPMRRVR